MKTKMAKFSKSWFLNQFFFANHREAITAGKKMKIKYKGGFAYISVMEKKESVKCW